MCYKYKLDHKCQNWCYFYLLEVILWSNCLKWLYSFNFKIAFFPPSPARKATLSRGILHQGSPDVAKNLFTNEPIACTWAIAMLKHQFPFVHWSQATLGLVSTWMGDPYPSAAGAVAELSSDNSVLCICVAKRCLEWEDWPVCKKCGTSNMRN